MSPVPQGALRAFASQSPHVCQIGTIYGHIVRWRRSAGRRPLFVHNKSILVDVTILCHRVPTAVIGSHRMQSENIAWNSRRIHRLSKRSDRAVATTAAFHVALYARQFAIFPLPQCAHRTVVDLYGDAVFMYIYYYAMCLYSVCVCNINGTIALSASGRTLNTRTHYNSHLNVEILQQLSIFRLSDAVAWHSSRRHCRLHMRNDASSSKC